jgi:hypothetical protein
MFATASAPSQLDLSASNTCNRHFKEVATTQKENTAINTLHTSQVDVITGTIQYFGSYLVQYSKSGYQLQNKGGNVWGGSATPTLQQDIWLKDVRYDTVM